MERGDRTLSGSSPDPFSWRRITSPTLLLSLMLALFGVANLWQEGSKAPGIDFYQAWVAARAASLPEPVQIYDTEAQRQLNRQFLQQALARGKTEREIPAASLRSRNPEINGTPFFYAVLSLFRGDFATAFDAFHLVSLLALLSGILLLCRIFHHPPPVSLLVIAFITVWFQPVRGDSWVGNVNSIQLGLIASYLALQASRPFPARSFIAGLLLGLTVFFKPNLSFVVPLLLVSWWVAGRRRELVHQLAGIAAAGAIAVPTGILFFGSSRIWTSWLAVLPTLADSAVTVEAGNFALVRLILDRTGTDVSVGFALLFPLCVLAAAFAAHRGRGRIGELENDALMVGIGIGLYLLTAWMVWIHYFVLLLPLVLFLMRPSRSDRADSPWPNLRSVIAAITLLAFSVDPWAVIPGFEQRAAQALTVSIALLLLLVISAIEQTRIRSTAPPSADA